MSNSDQGSCLSHVGLYVRDLKSMQDFLTDVFGLQVIDQGFSPRLGSQMVFLGGDAATHHQVVLVSGGPETSVHSRMHHMAFKVGSLTSLRAIRDRATAAGASKMRAVNHGMAWSIYFDDPEGNQIEVFLDTPFHLPQPYGEPLNLDQADEEVIAQTERQFAQEPGFCSRLEWLKGHTARFRNDGVSAR